MEAGVIEKAARLAVVKHAGQTRKGDGLPYIIHPMMVALKLAQHGFSDEIVAASLAHDLIEDGGCSAAELDAELGTTVSAIVQAVSNDENPDWKAKKLKYIETVRQGPDGAKAVCVADKIHNLESLILAHQEEGPTIWQKFNGISSARHPELDSGSVPSVKDSKFWFETEVLNMLKVTWQHPMLEKYAKLLSLVEDLA